MTNAPTGRNLRSISIQHVDDGGHIVEHSFRQTGKKYVEPKQFAFAKDDSEQLVDHLRKHLKVGSKKLFSKGKRTESKKDGMSRRRA